jgi:hypothetical protein
MIGQMFRHPTTGKSCKIVDDATKGGDVTRYAYQVADSSGKPTGPKRIASETWLRGALGVPVVAPPTMEGTAARGDDVAGEVAPFADLGALEENARTLRDARAEQRRLIVEYFLDGWPVARLVAGSGLSRARIYQILTEENGGELPTPRQRA